MKCVREDEKRKTELDWFQKFQKLESDCPRSNFIQSTPDIVFPKERLGIEITRYFLGRTDKGSPARELEDVSQKVVKKAQVIYEVRYHDHLEVSVIWATDQCPNREEQERLQKSISNAVIQHKPIIERLSQTEWHEFSDDLLQKFVHLISIYRFDEPGMSHWHSPIALCFGTLESEERRFQEIFDEKQDKTVHYRKTCDQVWLLIVADNEWAASSISSCENLAKKNFRSAFDRAFILDERIGKAFELRLESNVDKQT